MNKDTNVVQRLMAFLMTIVATFTSFIDGNLKGGLLMKNKTRKMRSLTAIAMALAMVLSLLGGISFAPVTAYASTNYTDLKVGDVIKVGDSINLSKLIEISRGEEEPCMIVTSNYPVTLVRANVEETRPFPEDMPEYIEYNVSESDSGTFYVFKYWVVDEWRYVCYSNWTVTNNSDGLILETIGEYDRYGIKDPLYDFAVHESATNTPTYTVTYNANGAEEGSVPAEVASYDANASVTVLGNTGDLEKDDYTFAGWNTKADGTGTDYAAGDTFTITADTTLYAKWTAASAGESKALANGTTYYIGDTMTMNENKYAVLGDTSSNPTLIKNGSYVVPEPMYNSGYKFWKFEGITYLVYGRDRSGEFKFFSGNQLTGNETVTGFKCNGGDGTATSPFTFELVFAESTTNTPTYTVTIPATLEVANKGWNELTGGITAKGSDFADNQTLSITASSTNSWALKKDETNKVGYNLVASGNSESTYSSTAEPASWEFSKTELEANGGDGTTKTAGIVVEDYSSKGAGSYEDTVTFTASVETESVQNITFTVKRVAGSISNHTDGTYTVESGTTWQQFINSGNAPACLSIGTSGIYSGKVCHDMNNGLYCCGGTLIANVADKKRVKSSDAIIDGATYGCSDYLGYEDHD